jgi:hypothetical protein
MVAISVNPEQPLLAKVNGKPPDRDRDGAIAGNPPNQLANKLAEKMPWVRQPGDRPGIAAQRQEEARWPQT